MWRDMDFIRLVKQFYSYYMAAVVVIDYGHGLRIECIVETNLIRVSQHCISRYITVTIVINSCT